MKTITRSVTVPIEVAHRSVEGHIHGHTLTAEVVTAEMVDLDVLQARLAKAVKPLENGFLENIAGRTFEDVAAFVQRAMPGVSCVIIRLPSRGHAITLFCGYDDP